MRRADLARLWVLMATVFVDMIGFLMVLPLLPFYAERLGADPALVTQLVAAFAFAQLVTAPFWGRLSDRFGRRPMLILGLLVSGAAFVLFAVASSMIGEGMGMERLGLWLLFVSRLVQGAGGATTGVVHAYVSDVVGSGERAKALGWMSAATSAGVMLGPALGSLAARWGEVAPGAIAALLCFANAAFAWRLLAEPSNAGEEMPEGGREPVLEAMRRVVLHPGRQLHSLIWIYALGMMAFMAMNSVVALFLERRFGATEETIGWFYVYVGGVSLVMRALVLGPVVNRLGEVRTLRLGALSIGVGLVAVSFTGDWGLSDPLELAILGIATLFVPVGTALLFPATTSQISARARRGETGQTMGVQQTFGSVARVIGPIWAGYAFRDLGIPTPFWISAAVMVAVFLVSLRVHPLGDRTPHQESTATAQPPVESEGV